MLLYRGCPDRCGLKPLPLWIQQAKPAGQLEAEGRWFTDSLEIALWYKEDVEGCVVCVDVPDEVAEASHLPNQPRCIQRFSLDLEREYFLPREWAEKARPS